MPCRLRFLFRQTFMILYRLRPIGVNSSLKASISRKHVHLNKCAIAWHQPRPCPSLDLPTPSSAASPKRWPTTQHNGTKRPGSKPFSINRPRQVSPGRDSTVGCRRGALQFVSYACRRGRVPASARPPCGATGGISTPLLSRERAPYKKLPTRAREIP